MNKEKLAVKITNQILESLKQRASPSKAPINVRMQLVICFGNLIIATGGYAFFMRNNYLWEPLYMLAYLPFSCFVLFVYFTHSAGQYTIKQSILITIAYFTEPRPRKLTVAHGLTLAIKENRL
jgi:hypothetical protein